MPYSALIRTFNSARTLPHTIASLQGQSVAPAQFIFVDSGSTDQTLQLLPDGSRVIRYQGEEFNYSSSINQGLEHVEQDNLLIVSSHTALLHPDAMAYALGLLKGDDRIGAAYFCNEETAAPTWERIDQLNFTGFNGVWNTCGVYRTELLRKRCFRPEVFIAEDQEWSRWLLESEGRTIGRISGGGMSYNHPLQHPMKKWLNEYVSIATFTKPEIGGWNRIARVGYRVVKPGTALRDRIGHFRLALALIGCRVSAARPRSLDWMK